jgi:hypothetical protein
VFDGTQAVHGELRLRVRIQKKRDGGGTHLLNATQALALEVLLGTNGEAELSKPVRRTKNFQELFFRNLLSHNEPDEFLLFPRLDCLIIGTLATLRDELQLRLVSMGSHGTQPGTVQDLLKVRKLMSPGHSYRTEIMAVGTEDLPDTGVPYLTVFDGALSFLKWRETWRRTHWIVVLDRTESHFAEAVNVLNQEYATDRINNDTPMLPGFPEGVETLLFKEGR